MATESWFQIQVKPINEHSSPLWRQQSRSILVEAMWYLKWTTWTIYFPAKNIDLSVRKSSDQDRGQWKSHETEARSSGNAPDFG